jgi:hypothetical protein
MQKNSQNFSMQEALRLANSDAGQRLLAILKESGGDSLSQKAAAGQYDEVQKSVASLMAKPEVAALLKELEGLHG